MQHIAVTSVLMSSYITAIQLKIFKKVTIVLAIMRIENSRNIFFQLSRSVVLKLKPSWDVYLHFVL